MKCLKALMVGLVLAGSVGLAEAKDLTFYPVETNASSMVLANSADKVTEGTSVGMGSMAFLAAPRAFSEKSVDMLALYAAYDCTVPGRWRPYVSIGFREGDVGPVFHEQRVGEWTSGPEDSLSYMLWTTACSKQGPTEAAIAEDLTTQAGRDAVLQKYRDQTAKLSP